MLLTFNTTPKQLEKHEKGCRRAANYPKRQMSVSSGLALGCPNPGLGVSSGLNAGFCFAELNITVWAMGVGLIFLLYLRDLGALCV